jgi:hypothetical protein
VQMRLKAHSWWLLCVAGLACLHSIRSAKLPSWRGPDTFFEGNLPSKRFSHGFAACDDGKIYVFGGSNVLGEACMRIPKQLYLAKSNRISNAFLRRRSAKHA